MTSQAKVQELRKLLEAAVCACITDKATTALQLSGGLDSSIVQAIGELDHLYCCTWPEFDNLSAAEKAARGKPIRPVTFTRSEMIEVALPEVARITEGKGTWSQCCQWFMAREMARDGMKVELNGEGADELFGGYARYRILYWLDRMMSDPHLEEYQGYIDWAIGTTTHYDVYELPPSTRMDLLFRFIQRTVPSGYGWLVGAAAEQQASKTAMTDTIGFADEQSGLVDLVAREDRIAAAHSLTHRHPFMETSVQAFAHTLTEADKITEHESKHILREVSRSLGVHQDITDEKTKRGLVVPPQWAPAGAAKWSRGWFDDLMAEAWAKRKAA